MITDPQTQSSYDKADITSVAASPVQGGEDNQRVLLRQTIQGNQRGFWNIMGSISVSPLNGQGGSISTTNSDGATVGMGLIPDNSGDFGFFAQDSNGKLLYKLVGSTMYVYDLNQNPVTNVMQVMKLPDGTFGWATAAVGKNVSDGFN